MFPSYSPITPPPHLPRPSSINSSTHPRLHLLVLASPYALAIPEWAKNNLLWRADVLPPSSTGTGAGRALPLISLAGPVAHTHERPARRVGDICTCYTTMHL